MTLRKSHLGKKFIVVTTCFAMTRGGHYLTVYICTLKKGLDDLATLASARCCGTIQSDVATGGICKQVLAEEKYKV